MKKLSLLPIAMLITMIYIAFWFINGMMVNEAINLFHEDKIISGIGLTSCAVMLFLNQLYGTKLIINLYKLVKET